MAAPCAEHQVMTGGVRFCFAAGHTNSEHLACKLSLRSGDWSAAALVMPMCTGHRSPPSYVRTSTITSSSSSSYQQLSPCQADMICGLAWMSGPLPSWAGGYRGTGARAGPLPVCFTNAASRAALQGSMVIATCCAFTVMAVAASPALRLAALRPMSLMVTAACSVDMGPRGNAWKP